MSPFLRRTFAILALLWCSLVAAQTQPAALPGMLPAAWRMQGEGEMRWFGLSIYSARLWTPVGAPLPVVTDSGPGQTLPNSAFALELIYARNIPGTQLVKASIEQLNRLGWRDETTLQRWSEALTQVFPDVREGERIVGIRETNGGASFYHQERLTGRLSDPELATAFFAIWLDPRTSEPGLRARLLGGRG